MLKADFPMFKIESKYWISESSLKRIIEEFESKGMERSMDDCKTLGIKIFHSKQIADSVQRFVMCQETPFVSKNVWDHIKRELGVIISNKTMSKFLKTKLRMSFKKASSRPSRLDVKRQQILKTLFAVYLAKQITDDSLLVNIDECYFSRQTKIATNG